MTIRTQDNAGGPGAWHSIPAESALQRLQSTPAGLDEDEIRRRLAQYGPNRLPPPRRRSALVRFLKQFDNVLIYVLLIAAVVTAVLGHWIDSGVIFAVVVINAAIGFVQEDKAEQALDAIRHMLVSESTVRRGGERQVVSGEQIVPGDVVLLHPGDKVPADLRLIQVRDLRIDESLLTGESVPVEKATDPVDAAAALGDRTCMAYSGTLVTAGQATGLAVATAEHTEIGRISQMLARVETLTTPLLRQVGHFGRLLSVIVALVAGATFFIGVTLRGYPVQEMFLAAVGLAVAAIPEGLPAILTITLAIGVQRMARRHAIIRHLPAVDTLGSVTVICSDKTGTLTRNEMTVTTIATSSNTFAVSGIGYTPAGAFHLDGQTVQADAHQDLQALARAALLCNDASLYQHKGEWRIQGDPTEAALVTFAAKAGLDREQVQRDWPRADEIPFESEHRFMATLHSHAGKSVIYAKGAPERLLELSTHQSSPSGVTGLDRPAWEQRAEAMAANGQRVLALASKPAAAGQTEITLADIQNDLVLLGLVGMIDPPRQEAITAINDCRAAGIRVKMITGDHALTARAIGRQMGIGDGEHALTGRELDADDSSRLRQHVQDVDVFARVSPEHKLRLVEAVQANGHIVAMTGDGVNDAPALKRADVGIAMGRRGTEASKEAADMVLTDDNFASIAHAVEEGRTVYSNLKKAILFILPTNGGQSMVMILAIALGRALPITPVQILWVNMVTAVTLALALAFEPPERDVMRRPPRQPHEPLLSGFFIWRITFVSTILCAGTFGLFLLMRHRGESIELARTVAVNTLVLFEVFYLFNTRFLTAPVLRARDLLGNRYILLAAVVIIIMQLLYTYVPLSHRLFGTASLAAAHWGLILPVALCVYPLVEIEKWIIRQRSLRHAQPLQ